MIETKMHRNIKKLKQIEDRVLIRESMLTGNVLRSDAKLFKKIVFFLHFRCRMKISFFSSAHAE